MKSLLRIPQPDLREPVGRALRGLPVFAGDSVVVTMKKELRVSGGRLYTGTGRGSAVSAASYLVERRMVLDAELLESPQELRRILVHELFHFVWRRLGNQTRREYHLLIAAERKAGARGELGWSAEWRKMELTGRDEESKSRRWRQYLCESFCDSAAWYFGTRHPEHTLARRFRERRKRFFELLLRAEPLRI